MTALRKVLGDLLPRSLPPVGICREESAAFVGVSPAKFDQMVADRRMPKPKRVDGRTIWSVRALTLAFDALPEEKAGNSWEKCEHSGSATDQES